MSDKEKGTVVVDGATGYVGSHLVHELCRQGSQVRAVVHPAAQELDCRFLASCGAQIIKTELSADSALLKEALSGACAVVHLIGSIAPMKGQKLEDLHGGQSRQLLQSCRNSGTKVVMLTALGTAADADSSYHRTKWQAEEFLRQSGLPHAILRPSLIVGRLVGRRDSKLMARYMRLIDEKERVPLIAAGKNLVQPIFIGDLVSAIVSALSDSSLSAGTLELGGTETISMKELVEKLMDILGKRKPLQAVPPALAATAALFMEMFQTVPLLSRDQVRLSLKDNVCAENALETVLRVKAHTLAEALATYKGVPQKANV